MFQILYLIPLGFKGRSLTQADPLPWVPTTSIHSASRHCPLVHCTAQEPELHFGGCGEGFSSSNVFVPAAFSLCIAQFKTWLLLQNGNKNTPLIHQTSIRHQPNCSQWIKTLFQFQEKRVFIFSLFICIFNTNRCQQFPSTTTPTSLTGFRKHPHQRWLNSLSP